MCQVLIHGIVARDQDRQRRSAPPARPPGLDALAAELGRGATLLRHPHARHAWAREGQRACLHANGLALPMGVASARRLAAADQLDADDFAALDAAGRDALECLVAAGHYQLAKPRRRR